MIALQQPVIEQVIAEARAGRYVEAWARAGEDASARIYVRYHAGDLEGALGEVVRDASDDPWLLSTGVEIALALHRGARAELLLERWRSQQAPTDGPRLAQAGEELARLRAVERGAAASVHRARWVVGVGGTLALVLLFALARRRD